MYVRRFEAGPLGVADAVSSELLACFPCKLTKLVLVDLLERGAYHAKFGKEAGAGEVENAGEKFSAGEIACSAEQHQHLRVESWNCFRVHVRWRVRGCHLLHS